jgi:GTP-binding protein
LIDSRVEPQKNDIDFCNWLGETGIPFLLIFTKADKQSAVKTDQTVAKFRKELLKSFEEVPKIFITSSENTLGREAVLGSISELNQAFIL